MTFHHLNNQISSKVHFRFSFNLPPGRKKLIVTATAVNRLQGKVLACSLSYVPYGSVLTLHTSCWVFQVCRITYPVGGGRKCPLERKTWQKWILSFHTEQEQSSGHAGKLVTLRCGCQQHALFYIIHMKNAIFTNILLSFFSDTTGISSMILSGVSDGKKMDVRGKLYYYFHLCYWSKLQ